MGMHVRTGLGALATAGAMACAGVIWVSQSSTVAMARPEAGQARVMTALVVNAGSDTVTPINALTNVTLDPIKVGHNPLSIAITPDGKTAYVGNQGADSVTAIDTTSDSVIRTISTGPTGGNVQPMVVSKDGKTVYVATGGVIVPISTATNTAGSKIKIGAVTSLAISPDGKTVYASGGKAVVPVNTATNTPLPAIPVAAGGPIAVTPDGKTVYVSNGGSDSVTPISTATDAAGQPIRVDGWAGAIAITPDGKTAYVASSVGNGRGVVTPISTATNTAGAPIPVGGGPDVIAITPDGKTAYVLNEAGSVTPISTATNAPGKAIPVGPSPLAMAMTPDGKTVYVGSDTSSFVTPISTATNTAGERIFTGGSSDAIAIAAVPTAPVNPVAASFVTGSWGVVLGNAGCMPGWQCPAQLRVTSDGGKHWRVMRAPDAAVAGSTGKAPTVASVVFANHQDGWVYGTAGLWYTRDGGGTWQQISLGGTLRALVASTKAVYAVVARTGNLPAELLASPINRVAWAPVGTITISYAAMTAHGTALWLGGTDHLWVSADGTRWHRYPLHCPVRRGAPYKLAGIAAADVAHAAFLCLSPAAVGTQGKEILTSADGGKTVKRAGYAPFAGTGRLIGIGPGDPSLITISAGSSLDLSIDGGRTWTQRVRRAGDASWTCLAYLRPATGWAIYGSPYQGALLETANSGRTWHKISF